MPIKIKIFNEDSKKELEEAVNAWISEKDPVLMTLKYNPIPNAKENKVYYSVLFLYREKELEA